jgi:hypothetical protein
MANVSLERRRKRIEEILARSEAGEARALDELAKFVETRRLANGRFILVPRGSPKTLRDISHDLIIRTGPITERKRAEKLRRYLEKKNDPAYHGPRIVAEGDSWFEYPCAKDLLEWLGEKYAVLSLAKAGDKWQDVKSQEPMKYDDGTSCGLFHNIQSEQPQIVLLSVGGNEVLGEIEKYVDYFDVHHPDRAGYDYILPNFENLLDDVEQNYRDYISQIVPQAHVILHSYDYPNVREQANGGQWIGGPLEHERHIPFISVWREIANIMLERFCQRLQYVADDFGGQVHFINQLGTIGTADYNSEASWWLWQDELHPSTAGSDIMYRAISAKIDEIFQAP